MNQVFSTATGTCTDENKTPPYTPSAALGDRYELAIESHVFLSKPGCHIFQFDDVKNSTDVKEGDILGFTYYGRGFAEIRSRPSGESSEINATAFCFDSLQPSLGSIITTSENSPSESKMQYAIAAIQQLPSLFWFSHNYSIGRYHEEATVRGPHNALTATTQIIATEGVANVTWATPKVVATNATNTITIYPHKGYNVTYVVDFGAGKNETVHKTRLDADLDVNFVYNVSGSYSISLYATNIISFQIKACYVVVQDLILGLAFYEPIRAVPLGEETIFTWMMRQGNGVNISVDFGDGDSFHNDSFDIAYLFAAMNNHTYAAIGEYTVTINASNCVSNASIEGLAVVEVPLSGVTCNVIHAHRDIEVNETVTVEITVLQGTNPEFFIDFGDGTATTTRELTVQHSYSYYAFFNVSISAYNNVSRENASKEIQVHKPVKPLIGFNVTCAHTNLTDNTPCMLNITEGTDFTCTWNWADGRSSETLFEELGNFTYHNYSAVGHYNVALNCSNRLNKTTAETTAIVEVPILGFQVDDPIAKPFQVEFTVTWSTASGTDAIFNVTFTHVISGMSFNATVTTSVDTTSGSAVITRDMMPLLGFYELIVTAVNYVTPRQTIHLTVLVDVPITIPVLNRASKFVEVHIPTNFSFQITTGSNVSLWWNFTDGSPVIHQYYQGPFPVDGMTIKHTFDNEGEYIVHLFGNNRVSNFTSVIPVYIQNPPNLTLTSNSPQNIPPGTITFTIAVIPGREHPTDANYTVHFGDGSSVPPGQHFAAPLVLQHSYQSHGVYVMNITVANEVQYAILETEVEVQTPIEGLFSFSFQTGPEEEKGKPGKGPDDTYFPNDFPVLFSTSIRNGTNVSYLWDFGDEVSLTTMNNSVNHTYEKPGSYMVKVHAENAVSHTSTTLEVNMQRMIRIKSFENNGPAKLDKPITFKVLLDEVGTDSCYFVNISDNVVMNFKNSKSCPEACAAGSSAVKILEDPSGFSWEHVYSKVGIFKLSIIACNFVSTVIATGEAACAAKPCKYPNVTMKPSLVGKSSANAMPYLKKKAFKIKNDIELDCEATDKTEFSWKVTKVETNDVGDEKTVSLPASVSLTESSLNIPPRVLPVHAKYHLNFKVAMVNVEGIYSTSDGFITVIPSEIEAVIDQGMSKAVGQGKSTTVSCLQTNDPDEEVNDPSHFQFCWFCAKKGSYDPRLLDNCTQLDAFPLIPIPPLSSSDNDTNATSTELDENGCFGYPRGRLNTSDAKITLNTLRMTAQSDYDVCVQVSKDTRKSSACITLQVTFGDPPEVSIT